MTQPYLVSAHSMVPIRSSTRYANRWQVMGKELYVDVAATQEVTRPLHAPESCSRAYRLREDADEFQRFLTGWMDQTLRLYRGFPGCHFCWPDLLNGTLRSEGNEDRPEFTMGGATRWLPTADRTLARNVSLQLCDRYTRGLALHEHIPIGFTVEIPAGSARNLPLCWLNAGEIVVRGPLIAGQYRLESITWFRNGAPSFTPWPARFPNMFLPPQRPYQPTSGLPIFEWWDTCQVWKAEAKKYIPTLQ